MLRAWLVWGRKSRLWRYLARALRLDASSQAAKSWILDLLLRGGLCRPAAPFAHPALRHQERVLSASFGPEGRRIVTASWNNIAQIWDSGSGDAIGRLMLQVSVVNFASFSPNGRVFVTAAADST